MTEFKEKEGGIHYILYIGAEEVLQYYIQAGRGIAGPAGIVDIAGFVSVAGIAGIIHRNKKNFFLFLPSHPHKCGSSALFIGVSRVRVGVRVELLPSHLPSPYPHTSGRKVSCQGFHG